MDAVLPLTSRDAERFEILWQSLERFVTGLDTLWVVVPDKQYTQLAQCLPQTGRRGARVRVESELEFLPTLKAFPKTRGWYRQMLIKLQAAKRVTSPYYLTLDADVIACRRVDLDALCEDSIAPCHVDHQDMHPKWYDAARDILGEAPPRAGISHGVTPALMHAKSVQSLMDLLTRRWASRSYGTGLRGLKQRFGRMQSIWQGHRADSPVEGWCAYLCWSRPWAEYALYFSYLELTGQFASHFREVKEGLYSVDGSVWFADDFTTWDPAQLFAGQGAPYFAVVQSNAAIAVSQLRDRLTAHLY